MFNGTTFHSLIEFPLYTDIVSAIFQVNVVRGYDPEVFIGRMPFLLPNQQRQHRLMPC